MSYTAPVIHYTFDTDGTNYGTLGSSNDCTIPVAGNVASYSDLSTIDTANKIEGTASISVGRKSDNADSFPSFIFNSGTPAWTISFWARLRSTNTAQSVEIYSALKASDDQQVVGYLGRDSMGQQGTTLIRSIRNSGTYSAQGAVPNLRDDNWHHYVVTTTKVYLDNALILSSNQSSNFDANTDINFILGTAYWIDTGNTNPDWEGGIDGNFDNVRGYDFDADATFVDYLYKIGSNTNIGTLSNANVTGLQNAGASVAQLITAGISLADLISAGVSVADLIAEGATLADLISGGVSVADLLAGGISVADLLAENVSLTDLISGGVSVADLLAENISLADLISGGVSVANLVAGGASVADLLAENVSVADLLAGGVSVADLLAENVSVADLLAGGASVADLLAENVSVADLLAENVSVADLVAGGVSVADLLAENVSVADLVAASVSVADLLAGGVSVADLLAENVSVADLLAGGVSVPDLVAAGVSVADLVAAGVSEHEIDIELMQIKIHDAFTINDGTNNSAFTENTVYTPDTFAAKLTTDLNNTVTVDGDYTLTDSTQFKRIYLQFTNAVTLTNMPKYIFNIPFSDFSVKAGGQVNFRSVNLDASMNITTSYNTTSNTSTIVAGNHFINNFINTIETDLVNFTLSYDEPNKRIIFDSLAQDISLSITSINTTIFDTSITEITQGANTLPFITYGQPDPTLKNYSNNGITVDEFTSNGYTISQLLSNQIIPIWNYDTDANHFDQSYLKGFTDVSGSVIIRNDNRLITNGDLSLGGNLITSGTTSLVIDDMTLKSRLFMGEDISANGKVNIGGDLSVNGQFSGDFANGIIPLSAISGGDINISGNVFFTDDVSFNGSTVDVNMPVTGPTRFQVNQIEFNDGTTMTTHDDNILSGSFADSNPDVVFKDSFFASVTCGSATAQTKTGSDYRIKENVTELNENDTVDALVPIQYNNTVSGNHEFGLLAHELQEIYPDLVNGEKDGDEYQQVHYNGLIGVLVKEVQDLKQRLSVLNKR
jgi:hypothetical protein